MVSENGGKVRKPKFGEWFRNTVAGEQNPMRDGMFLRTSRVKANRFGLTYGVWELTDGKGRFWKIEPKHLIPLDPPNEQDAKLRALAAEMRSSEWGFAAEWADQIDALLGDAEADERVRAANFTMLVRYAGAKAYMDAVMDGVGVHREMSDWAKCRTSPENISDVLDAVARIARRNAPHPA